MNINAILGLAAIVVTILVGGGGIVAYFGRSFDKGTIGSLQDRLDAVEASEKRLKAQTIDQLAQIVALQTEVAELRATRPSAEAIEYLIGLVRDHDARTPDSAEIRRILRAAK